MDRLFVQIVPTFMNDLTSVMAYFGEIFAAGVLFAFLVWVVAFVCREVFRVLDLVAREGG